MVTFSSEAGSAVEGLNYNAVAGQLRFAPGETFKTIHVPILRSPGWSATLEFSMRLSDVRGASLGFNLDWCRVCVSRPRLLDLWV